MIRLISRGEMGVVRRTGTFGDAKSAASNCHYVASPPRPNCSFRKLALHSLSARARHVVTVEITSSLQAINKTMPVSVVC
jgi:hypothetical protein